MDCEVRRLMKKSSGRPVALAEYMLLNHATVRGCAACFGLSKSTVHKDVTERLSHIDTDLCEKVRILMEYNKSERHIRGGEATRRKYAAVDCNKN